MAGHFMQNALLSAWRNRAPAEVMDRFENYLAYVKQLMPPAPEAAQDPAAMVDPAMAQGTPMPQPQAA